MNRIENYTCPFTTENGNICQQNTNGVTFCKRHDEFLKSNSLNLNRKKYKTKIVYRKHEKSRDPDRVLKEMIGRTQYCISECIYPDLGHQMRLVKLLNIYLTEEK